MGKLCHFGRQPCQCRQLRRERAQCQQLLGRQPQLQHRSGRLSAVILRQFEIPSFPRVFHLTLLVDLIHPPSCLPISSTVSCHLIYLLASITFTSLQSRKNTRRKFSLMLIFSNTGSFSAFESWLAQSRFSSTSKVMFSHLCQSVWRSCFLTLFR